MARLTCHPLTLDRWEDLERLFGPKGACAGCWCMWWRLSRGEFEQKKGDGNRIAFRTIVESGRVPGLLAYDGDEPVGWCAVAPRDEYGTIQRSRTLRPVDDVPVWSIPCLFVARTSRGRGIALALIRAAARYARGEGGRVLESYPTVPRGGRLQDISTFMGTPALFERAGFRQVARPSEARMIMRKRLK